VGVLFSNIEVFGRIRESVKRGTDLLLVYDKELFMLFLTEYTTNSGRLVRRGAEEVWDYYNALAQR